ncbi:ribosomal-protein-alanine N-acetyltransferase [Halonotius terrestris]|uniref:Ribosomal-protein-alanine N-acetyltransferase n=1 Tax=Halonotius terrestris TaxID=2487750 RepID=A0A8J8PDT6_9EURY|nr:ribosomal protein S18-alanine N-acetyltransferase [Halonotius terrestris]TQQ83490.1 ribosomal-protein-alanine N-acetyltransferase [Halonotius terrestris]
MATRSKQGPDSVSIRQATRADLLSIYRIEKQAFDQPWPYPAFEKFLGEPNFLVAIADDHIAGYVVADTTPNAGRDIGHIKNLAVHPAKQGEGLGRSLLQRAILGLTVADAARIKLEVREGNVRARKLYRDAGFEPTKRLPRYYDDGEAALVLVKGPEPTADLGR